MIMDTLLSIRVFCQVAEQKSFTAAAGRLTLSTAMVSKHVMHLEARLGTRLLNRTSRHVSLTEAGGHYYEQARHTIEGLDEVEAVIGQSAIKPSGILRVSVPVWLANSVFVRAMSDYRLLYPDVRFDLDVSGRQVNMLEEGLDLIFRVAELPDSGLIVRTIAQIPFQLIGAPSYLDRAGRPRTLEELDGHSLLFNREAYGDGKVELGNAEERRIVKFDPVLGTRNDTLLQYAAVAGMGLTFLPQWMTETELASGGLELVLPELTTIVAPLYAGYPSRRYLSAKVRTFLDFITSYRDRNAAIAAK